MPRKTKQSTRKRNEVRTEKHYEKRRGWALYDCNFRMFSLTLYILGLIAASAVMLDVVEAATPANASCSLAFQENAVGGIRRWTVNITEIPGCPASPEPIIEVNAGDSFTISCQESTQGTPDGIANSLTIRLISDNDNFGSATPTAFKTISVGAATCGPTKQFTAYCTDNGDAGGSPRYGIVRIHVAAIRTAIPTYNVHSEDAKAGSLYGILRCRAVLGSLDDSPTQTTYVGGDSFGVSHSTDGSSAYDTSSNAVSVRALCDASEITLGGSNPTGTPQTVSSPIQGNRALWIDDCALSSRLVINRNSAVTGYTSEKYTSWAANAIGVSCTSTTCTKSTGKNLDRTLSYVNFNCVYSVNATTITPTIAANRNEPVTSNCDGVGQWQNARGTVVANNKPAIGYHTRSTAPDVTDYPATNFAFGGGGSATFTSTSVITAIPGQYHQSVETYATASRLSTGLHNFGDAPNTYLLSSNWTIDTVRIAVNNPNGDNGTSVIVRIDTPYVTPEGVRGARGNARTGAIVTCQLLEPGNTPHTLFDHGLSQSGTGNASTIEYPSEPPIGFWPIECEATGSGNAGFFNTTMMVITPLTSDKQITIVSTIVSNETCTYRFNATFSMEFVDPVEFDILQGVPDTGLFIRLDQYNSTTGTIQTIIPRTPIPVTSEPHNFAFCLDEVPAYQPNHNLHPARIAIWGNVSGVAFLRTESVTGTIINAPTLLDGVTVRNFTMENAIEITSAFDEWIPVLFLGGAAALFALSRMFFPTVASLLSMVAQFFDPPIYGIPGAAMIIGIALLLQIMSSAFKTG